MLLGIKYPRKAGKYSIYTFPMNDIEGGIFLNY